VESERLSFKGTDYLNITRNKEFKYFLNEGFKKYGSSFGGSRLSGNFADLYEEAENRLAEISGAQASVSFSSGTLAGLALIKQLEKHELIYSPDAHPAIQPNHTQKTDKSYDEWVEFLLATYHKQGKHLVLLSNSLNALKCEKYQFSWINELAKHRKITIVIDDSHGFGILGKNGAGIYNELADSDHIEKIVISSLGKAWGIPGGVILGTDTLIEKLKKSALFGGGSPVIPAYFNAFLKAENIYTQNRKKLKDNIEYFKTKLDKPEMFHSFEGFPAFYTKHHEIYDLLNKKNIEISSFNYPSPEDERYTRIVLNSGHNHIEIDKLCNLLNTA
jgi:7-keto-8-aminopelargonate synthetase-like enzyme